MKKQKHLIPALLAAILIAFLVGEWHGRRAALRYHQWDATCIIHQLGELYANQSDLATAQHVHSEMVLTNLAIRAAFLRNPMITRTDPTTEIPYPDISWSKERRYVQGLHDRLHVSFATTGNLFVPVTPGTRQSEHEIPNQASQDTSLRADPER